MFFRQVIHEDLGCASYLVGDVDEGVAAVVDPQWDIEPYLRLSRLHGVRIEHVLETHNHADHVSGHGRLARATGRDDPRQPPRRRRVRARGLRRRLDPRPRRGRDRGDARPPATGPSTPSFLLRDRGQRRRAGRGADRRLAVRRRRRPPRPRGRARPRARASSTARCTSGCSRCPPTVEVWPGHLGGSLCGGSGLDHRTSSTIGFELAPQPRRRASPTPTSSSPTRSPPSATGRRTSSTSSRSTAARWSRSSATPTPLSPAGGRGRRSPTARCWSTRAPTTSSTRPTSRARSAPRPTTPASGPRSPQVVPPDVELIVVAASDGYELAAADLLASVGLRVRGFLAGGMTAWRSEGRPVEPARADRRRRARRPARRRATGRRCSTSATPTSSPPATSPGSVHIPYGELARPPRRAARASRRIATVCSGGKRSGLAASILARAGSPSRCTSATAGWRAGGAPDARWSPRDKGGARPREGEERFLRGRATPVPRAVCRACAEGVPAPATSGGRISLPN